MTNADELCTSPADRNFTCVCQDMQSAFVRCQSLYDDLLSFPRLDGVRRKKPPTVRAAPPSSSSSSTAVSEFMERYKRATGNRKQVVRAFHAFGVTDSGPRIVEFKKLDLLRHTKRVFRLDACDEATLHAMNALLNKKNLASMTQFQIDHGVHYGMYDDSGTLVTFMCILTGLYAKNAMQKIAVSVDWLVGIDCVHNSSYMINALKTAVGKKAGSSVFTQCINRTVALKFWGGRLTRSSYANVLVGLFHLCNSEYVIYLDSVNMMT